jgi:DNA-binding XRE family transcriptional regulator
MNYRKLIRDSNLTQGEVADMIDINRSTLYRFLKDPDNPARHYIKEKIDRLFSVKPTPKKEVEEEQIDELPPGTSKMDSKGNLNASIKLNKSISGLSLPEVVKLFELDETKWKCVGYTTKSWDTTMKGPEDTPITHRNYSASAKFEPINQITIKPEEVREIFEEIKAMPKDHSIPEYVSLKEENVLVLPIFDAHIGKLAWGKETRENYDIKIGISRFRYAVKNLLSRSARTGFSKIIFPVG